MSRASFRCHCGSESGVPARRAGPGRAALRWGARRPPPPLSRVMERTAPRPHPSWVPKNSGRAHRRTQPPAAGAVPTQARRVSTDWDHSTLFLFLALPRPAVPGLRGRAQRGGGGPRGRDAGGHGPRRKPEPRPDLQGHPRVAFPAGFPARAVRPAALRLRRRPRPTPGAPASRGPGARPEELEGSPAPRPPPARPSAPKPSGPAEGRAHALHGGANSHLTRRQQTQPRPQDGKCSLQ